MNSVLSHFWKLYGAGLLHCPITDFEPLTPDEWKQIHALARRTKLSGVVLDGVGMLPDGLKPPAGLTDKWMMEVVMQTQAHWDHNRVIADLFHRWHSGGVHPVLLKGRDYARLYRNPSVRSVGDIDVYVGPTEFDRAMEVVNALPLDHDELPDIGKHIEFFYRNKGIELHRQSAHIIHSSTLDAQYQQWAWEVLAATRAGFHIDESGNYADAGEWIATPEPTFGAFYNFLHLWGHIYSGPMKIQPIGDWVLMLRRYREELDRAELESRLRQFRLLRYWQWMGCIAVKHLGASPSDIPFYDPGADAAAERLFRYIHKELFASRYDYRSTRNLRRRWHNFSFFVRHHGNRLGVFPTADVAREFGRVFFRGIKGIFAKTTQDGEFLKA